MSIVTIVKEVLGVSLDPSKRREQREEKRDAALWNAASFISIQPPRGRLLSLRVQKKPLDKARKD